MRRSLWLQLGVAVVGILSSANAARADYNVVASCTAGRNGAMPLALNEFPIRRLGNGSTYYTSESKQLKSGLEIRVNAILNETPSGMAVNAFLLTLVDVTNGGSAFSDFSPSAYGGPGVPLSPQAGMLFRVSRVGAKGAGQQEADCMLRIVPAGGLPGGGNPGGGMDP